MIETLEEQAKRSNPGKPALRLQRMRARALVALGSASEALELLEAARSHAREQHNVSYEWRLAADLAHAHLAAGNREAARSAASDALEQIDAIAPRIADEQMRTNFVEKAIELLPATLRRRASATPGDVLTAREQEIASLVAQGLTSREIAGRLVLSARTVESHVANAMARLGFTTRAQLAAWAVEHRHDS